MSSRTNLTNKEKRFCEEYIANNYHAVDAYQIAYSTPKDEADTAKAVAYKVLKRPLVKKYIKELQKDAYERQCISAERVAERLAAIAFADKDDDTYNVKAQLKALDLLQKQLGLQQQKLTADVDSNIAITVDIEE